MASASVKKSTTEDLERNELEKPSVSFRVIERNLCDMTCELNNSNFFLHKSTYRMCLHQGLLWFPSKQYSNSIDVYSCTGKQEKSLPCERVNTPRSLHPLTDTQLLLAADSGLHVYNTETKSVSHTIREGFFWDVHSSESHVVALEWKAPYHYVHVFHATVPPTHSHSFSLEHGSALSVLTYKDHVYVSATAQATSVCKYTLQGELLERWGRQGKAPGELNYPLLSCINTEGCLLVADSKSVLVISASGEASVVSGLEGLKNRPNDVVIVGDQMFVLYGKSIETYKVK